MGRRGWGVTFVGTLLIAGAGQVAAQSGDGPRTLTTLLDCREVVDDAARLRCFDGAAAKLATARRSGDLVALDGKKVAAVRRQEFGLAPTRTRHEATAETQQLAALQQIESTIASVRSGSYGRYTLSLANGGVWENVDPLSFPPAVKAPIRIVRAGFGGYRATIGKGRSFLVKRLG